MFFVLHKEGNIPTTVTVMMMKKKMLFGDFSAMEWKLNDYGSPLGP